MTSLFSLHRPLSPISFILLITLLSPLSIVPGLDFDLLPYQCSLQILGLTIMK